MRMNSEYFISNVLVPITKCDAYMMAKKENKKFTLHMNNCKVHKSKKILAFLNAHGIYIAPHPPYSPDLDESDFFLFGAQKILLKFLISHHLVKFFHKSEKNLPLFHKRHYTTFFLELEKRLKWVIENNGDYYRPS